MKDLYPDKSENIKMENKLAMALTLVIYVKP